MNQKKEVSHVFLSELRDTVLRLQVDDLVGLHMFLMQYTVLSETDKQWFFPPRILDMAKKAGPPWSDVLANKADRSEAFTPRLDIQPYSDDVELILAHEMKDVYKALTRGDVQPWGAMIRRCIHSYNVDFRPAAKRVHRMMCYLSNDARAVRGTLAGFFGRLGYADKSFWVDVMCGDSTFPVPPEVQGLIFFDLTGPRLAKYAAEVHEEMEKASQRRDEAEEAQAAANEVERAAFKKRMEAAAAERAERKAAFEEASRRRQEEIEHARRQQIVVGAAGLAAAAVIGTLVVRRVRRRKRK